MILSGCGSYAKAKLIILSFLYGICAISYAAVIAAIITAEELPSPRERGILLLNLNLKLSKD